MAAAEESGSPARRVSAVALTWWVGLAFVAINVYYAHRWVFRYNSSNTSPTYSDTPTSWKAGKYVLIALVTLAMAVWLWRRGVRRRDLVSTSGFVPTVAVWVVLAFGVTLVASGAENAQEQLTWFAFTPIVLGLAFAVPDRAAARLAMWLGVGLVAYHAVFTAIQLWYYFAYDRLPALAYGQGALDRFGGGLDDPNGFGMMMVLPALLVVMMWRSFPARWMPVALAAVCAVLLFVPISFSTAVGLVVGLLALAPLLGRLKVLLWVFGGLVVVGAGLLAVPYVRRVVANKSDSARTRLDLGGGEEGLSGYLDELDGGRFWFGWPGRPVFSENSYVLAFTSFGVVGLALLLVVIVVALRQGARAVRQADAAGAIELRNVLVALTAFLAGFAVAAAGVPYFSVVPTNMLFWIVATVVAMGPSIVERWVAATSTEPERATDAEPALSA